jgi:UDP-hydrolysing UDP-N-acetyl-D-glucosamine 2-epimerase
MPFNREQKMKVCVFTAARSDYFLLRPLLCRLHNTDNIDLQLVVSGMHISTEYGETVKLIEKDQFPTSEKISTQLSSNHNTDIVASMGIGMIHYSRTLERLAPDIVVILGDRYEMMSFAISAYIMRIPIAHIHGGELTYGSFDDGLRHCITKLSTIHFPATEEYRNRIIQMGEHPDTVFNVGALAVENIHKAPMFSIKEIANKLNIKLRDNYFLVTVHPETESLTNDVENAYILAEVLKSFPNYDIIWTISNADPNGKLINKFILKNKNFHIFDSLGELYLPVMKHAAAVIGNSSSGLIEAPILGVPTINIGNRQDGRIRCSTVVDCSFEKKSIFDKVNSILKARQFDVTHPYGEGAASAVILEHLRNKTLFRKKQFYDIK